MIKIVLISALVLSLNSLAKSEFQAEAINIETGEVFAGEKVKWNFRDALDDTPRFLPKNTKNKYTIEKAKVYALAKCSAIDPEPFWRKNKTKRFEYSYVSNGSKQGDSYIINEGTSTTMGGWPGIRLRLIRSTSPMCKVSKLNEEVFIKDFEEYKIKKENLLDGLDKYWDDLIHIIAKCITFRSIRDRESARFLHTTESIELYKEGLLTLDTIVPRWAPEECIRAEYENYPKDFVNFMEKGYLEELSSYSYEWTYFERDTYQKIIHSSVLMKEKILEEERADQEKIILAALVDRCIGFGWDSDQDIHACVNQEAYRDLLIQEQKIKIQKLEKKLANSYSQARLDNSPIFLDILNFYSQQTYSKNNASLHNEIARLKSQNSSLRSIQSTQRALESLYNN